MMKTDKKYSLGELKTGCSTTPPSIPISEHSLIQDARGYIEALRILSPPVSLAPHSALPESSARKATPETNGRKLPKPFAWFSHKTYSWKMCPEFLESGIDTLDEFLGTWPKWGMIVNGVLYPRKTPGLYTKGKDGGAKRSWWPTPTKRGWKHGGRGVNSSRESIYLNTAVMYPTPTKSGGGFNKSPGGKIRPSLDSMARQNKWPTPTRQDYRKRGPNSRQQGLPDVFRHLPGQLNPDWEEWLMGWPTGWTDLKPMDRGVFDQWRRNTLLAGPWFEDPSETGKTPRTVDLKTRADKTVRKNRVMAIGDGQIPQSFYLAWKILAKD